MLLQAASALLLIVGCGFYLAGTAGMLRFPDALSRLHALTKADNVGLFLICASMALQAGSLRVALQLAIVWLLALAASTVSAQLIARRGRHGAGTGE